jgi:hypothetical protein
MSKNIYKLEFIVQHQILIFFILTFLFSWTIWFLTPVLSAGDSTAKLVITLIGALWPSVSSNICIK